MIKVLTAAAIREADQYTITHEPVRSFDLMERAASAFSKRLLQLLDQWEFKQCHIVCGMGNNGGDGLAIARLIHQKVKVRVSIIQSKEKGSEDFEANVARLQSTAVDISWLKPSESLKLNQEEVLVDALLGTGLNKPIQGDLKKIVQQINAAVLAVVSVDMPTGLFDQDNRTNDAEAIIKATVTISFEVPKLAFFFPANSIYVGHWQVVPIQLHPDFLQKVETPYFLWTEEDARAVLRPRNRFSHKGTFGHAMIAAGSYGQVGALVLAATACLRSGIGLLTVTLPDCAYEIVQSTVPEAMVVADVENRFISDVPITNKHTAIGIGPGIGKEEKTQKALKRLIQNANRPLILDADALNILADHKTWLAFLPPESILTPHPGEFRRLVGDWESDFERHEKLVELARKTQSIIVLKGAYSAVASPDGKVFFNSSGNPGMATGGSGDVLTGIITALRGQGYGAEQAALLGVYLHGLAGDIAAAEKSEHGVIARDIIAALPQAFIQLQGQA